jgi:GAF domain-containing protein
VSLLADGTVLGLLQVGSLGGRAFTRDDVALLQLAVDRAAVAVQALASRTDREAATALSGPPEAACASLMTGMLHGERARDDIALLMLRRAPAD